VERWRKTPPGGGGGLLLVLLSSGITTSLTVQMVNLICSSVIKFGLQVGYRFYGSNYKFITIHQMHILAFI
jgi:hypothetical protein